MQINFKTIILDLEGDPMREPQIDKTSGEVKFEQKLLDFPSLEAAQARGYRDATIGDDGRIYRAVPLLEEISLQRICLHALIRKWDGEELTHEKMFDRWGVARRIKEELDDEGNIDLEKEDREIIVDATDNYSEQNRIYFARARELLGVEKFKKRPTPKPASAPVGMPPGALPQ